MQVDYRHFDVLFGCFVFGSVSLAFQSVLLGVGSLVFHWWGGKNGSFLRLREVFAVDFVGFALTAVGVVVLAFAGVVFASFPLFLALPSLLRIGGRPR